jgi:transposase, IS6 family
MPVSAFNWNHFAREIILQTVRWYFKCPLSYKNLEEIMAERGIKVDQTTIMRWLHQYSSEIEKKVHRNLKPINDSWRADETCIKVKYEWKYLYRAVDSDGNTIDFMLSAKRDRKAAKKFFRKALGSNHNQMARMITNDKNAAYPRAIDELKSEKKLFKKVEMRKVKYLNTL